MLIKRDTPSSFGESTHTGDNTAFLLPVFLAEELRIESGLKCPVRSFGWVWISSFHVTLDEIRCYDYRVQLRDKRTIINPLPPIQISYTVTSNSVRIFKEGKCYGVKQPLATVVYPTSVSDLVPPVWWESIQSGLNLALVSFLDLGFVGTAGEYSKYSHQDDKENLYHILLERLV